MIYAFLKGLLGHDRADKITYFVERHKSFFWGFIVALAVVVILF